MVQQRKFPTELKELKYEIEGYAKEYGLDFFPVIFEILDFEELNEIAAYSGFPGRYPHWRFGMQYEQLSKGYSYGLSKIYEMVINNDPCYAYLLKSNQIVDQKLVMSHVYGHGDFFKNNLWFSKTNRNMVNDMANHGSHIRKYIDLYGEDVVEDFINTCLSIEDLIDSHSLFIKRKEEDKKLFSTEEDDEITPDRFKSKGYMKEYINPPEILKTQTEKLKKERDEKKRKEIEFVKIDGLEKDIMKFLINYAPLENWQRDVLSIIRKEAYYFAPQRQTKIMNEGWASYWHSKIMTERAMKDSEMTEFAKHHAGTMGIQPGRINPYKLGLELFLDIEDRWNKGKFGLEYESCKDFSERKKWDKKLGFGREKIFEVREIYNDSGFIDAFLTEDFCRKNKLFTYSYDEKKNVYEIDDREFQKIKQTLISNLTNFGKPEIRLKDANYNNSGELLLTHEHRGIPLKMDYANETLKNLFKIWKKSVALQTKNHEGKNIIITYFGGEIKIEESSNSSNMEMVFFSD